MLGVAQFQGDVNEYHTPRPHPDIKLTCIMDFEVGQCQNVIIDVGVVLASTRPQITSLEPSLGAVAGSCDRRTSLEARATL